METLFGLEISKKQKRVICIGIPIGILCLSMYLLLSFFQKEPVYMPEGGLSSSIFDSQNQTYRSVKSGRDTDKWKDTGLTKAPASKVSVPLIQESPVNLECKVVRADELGSHHMFLAEVVAVDVDDAYFDEKDTFHLSKAKPMAYSHGRYYGLGEQLGTFGYSVRKAAGGQKNNNKKTGNSKRGRKEKK